MPELTIPEDAYVSIEQADNYHRLRSSFESWNELSAEEKARRLVSASDFLDFTYPFSGEKADPEQGREFPRKGRNGEPKPIPKAVCFAVCELALQADLNQNPEQRMSSVTVGSISVHYDDTSQVNSAVNRFDYVKALLSAYLDERSAYGAVALARG